MAVKKNKISRPYRQSIRRAAGSCLRYERFTRITSLQQSVQNTAAIDWQSFQSPGIIPDEQQNYRSAEIDWKINGPFSFRFAK